MIVSLKNLNIVVTKLRKLVLNKNIVVLLRGDLASGKTTLVKEFVHSIDIKDKVTSPTFSIQALYGDTIFHYDVYNKTLDEFVGLGLLEEFEKDGIHFVEWGDSRLETVLKEYGFDVLVVNIIKKDDKREYIIES